MGLFSFFRRLLNGPKHAPRRARRAADPPSQSRPQSTVPQTNWPAPPAAPPPPKTPTRRSTTLALDGGAFQPLSTEQVKAQAAGQRFTGWFEFGRRDRIPSIVDPRTQLIDRALVGQGLITPDDLVRIHRLGEQMDEFRPQKVGAHALGERAVQADKEARRRIKAERKAAAAAREAAHAARVAENKRLDIIYLGRGVSAGLADRRSHLEKLAARGLPSLSSPADVAAAMKITVPKLRWLAFAAEASTVCHYVHFQVPKKSGGERTLSAPHEQLAAAQRWILENVLGKLAAHDAAHGFVTGRSILTNAIPHVGSAVVVNCDLTDFFPSITVHRVIGLFKQLGYSPAVSTVLGLLVTESPRRKVFYNDKPWWAAVGPRGLPQGACTSPAISNLIARRLDARLSGISHKFSWQYTRYADDLSFSSKAPSDRIGYLLARVRHIASDEGFAVNEKKTRVLQRATRQAVTGVVTNDRPSAPRKLRRKLRAILHNASKSSLNAQNRNRGPDFAAWVGGNIEYVKMLNSAHGQVLKRAFDRL